MCRQVIREFCAQAMPILLVPGDYAARLAGKGGEGRMEYISGNVTDQVRLQLRDGDTDNSQLSYVCVRVVVGSDVEDR